MFKTILLLISLLAASSASYANQCIQPADNSDKRLIEFNCEISDDNILLKEFTVYGYKESFLSDRNSNRLTLNLVRLPENGKIVRIVAGNVVNARLFDLTEENEIDAQVYCNDMGDVTKSPSFNFNTEVQPSSYKASALFKKTNISWGSLNLRCHN